MTIPPPQRDVAMFLTKLAGTTPIETHISAVFVGPEQVWKLKKAVCMPFVDFSSLEARRHFLCRELELNQPDAPGIYCDVAVIERDKDGDFTIKPASESRAPQDWVLRMLPIPPENFLDKIVSRSALTPELQDALGDCVAHYHQARPPIRGWDSTRALQRAAEGCAVSALAAELPAAEIGSWQVAITAALERNSAWLSARADLGFVRRGHGDLHLGNLCLWQGKPLPFDALEFDEALAKTDVGYDLAFLLMDLDVRCGRPAANRVLNRYIARTGDAGLSRGLPMFFSLRAIVRALVEATSGHAEAARRYFAASIDYLKPVARMTVAIGGLPGSGKSTLARGLAPRLGRAPGAVVLRSDEIRKRAFGVAPEQRLPAPAYAASVDAAINKELVELTRLIADGGHSVVADATFMDPDHRRAIAGAAQPPFIGIWLTASAERLEDRLRRRVNDASDATPSVLRRALTRDPGLIDWLQVDATDSAEAAGTINEAIEGCLPLEGERLDGSRT